MSIREDLKLRDLMKNEIKLVQAARRKLEREQRQPKGKQKRGSK